MNKKNGAFVLVSNFTFPLMQLSVFFFKCVPLSTDFFLKHEQCLQTHFKNTHTKIKLISVLYSLRILACTSCYLTKITFSHNPESKLKN